MWAKLQSVVTEDELESVPKEVKDKINDHLEQLSQLIDDLKNENAEITAVSEQQQFQFEKEISESHAQQKESAEMCLKLKSEVAELEDKLNSVQNELRELQKTHGTTTVELQSVKRTSELLQQEKKQLAEQLEKRREEIEKLNGELKRLVDETTQANEEKHAAIANAEEAKMHESTLQHQVNRLEQEKVLLEQQISDLNAELSQKNHEIHTLKREKSTVVLDLQSKLEHRTDEVHLLEKQTASLKETSDEKDRRIEALAEKIRSLNETIGQTEEHFQLELNAQTKLVELYKKASEDNQKRVQELVSAFEEAQKLLQEASEGRNEAEKRCEDIESQYKKCIQNMEKEISNLKEELKHANDICQGKVFTSESLEALFPTAAATSKAMRSGMTLTQLYSEYVKAQEEIQNLKTENMKLGDQLKQVVAEIEENTPIINEKMEELQKALETISCLRTKLASSLTDFEKLQSDLNDTKRIRNQLERENNRLKMQITDLNRQVQVLLKEVEEAKGGFIKGTSQSKEDEQVSSSDEVTADKVISRHLVSFRDIVELQTKNQQLLAVVRELSEHQEEQEKKIIAEKTAEFQKELQSALSQLEEMKKNRVKQAELVQSVVRQRDMYRVLLTNHGYSESMLGSPKHMSSMNVSKGSLSPGTPSDTTKNALQQLQSQFDIYRTERAENEKLLNEQLDKVRIELSDLRVENAKLASQLEYSEERVSILQTNMENYKKEAAFLREKNQKHSSLITQHQQTIQSLKQELLEAHEKLAKNEVSLDNLKSERDILKGVEKRLLLEKESLFREQQQKSQILANLQTVQNNLERIESETKRNLQYQLEKCEKENAMLKAKLDSANEDYKSAVSVWENHTKELQKKIDAEVEKNHKLHEDLVDAYSRVHSTSQELSAVKAALSSSNTVSPGDKKAASAAAREKSHHLNEVKNLKDQLNESQNKIKALQEQLDLSKKSSEHYSKMCNDLELRVKELDEINKQLNESMESSLGASNDARKSLEQILEEMEKTNRDLIEENMKLTQQKDSQVHELEAQVNALKSAITANKDSMESAVKTADQARTDCMAQKKLWEETQAKYERELMLHAENVKTLTELKVEHEKCQEKIEELSTAARDAKQALESHKASWAEREQLLLKEHEALKDRVATLEAQNSGLLNELSLIGTQMTALQAKSMGEVPSVPPDVDLKDTQHLLQIIQYLKKEKEIISTQYDSAQSENIRLKLKVEHLISELEEVKKELKELQDTSQERAVSDAQHSELLHKIEMMNLLTESNSLLRIEKDKLVESNKELEQKLCELETKMKPLSDANKELQSQAEFVTAENAALRQEVSSWKLRTNQLLEQSHRIGPHEYKNLTRELEELKTHKVRLTEELQRRQNELTQSSSSNQTLKKELEAAKSELQEKVKLIEKMQEETQEHHKTMLQIKKIGRKYKTQYDELKVAHDALLAKAKMAESAAQDPSLQDMQKKLDEGEKVMRDLKEEADKQKETALKAQKEVENILKQASEKEEKAKKLLAQVRQRYNQINSQRDVLEKENTALSKELEEVKGKVEALNRSADEENVRAAAMKSQWDAKLSRLEREVKLLRESKEMLERQYEEVCQKLAQQQKQASKPTAVGGIVERGSGSSEPLTANIKPLSAPVQASGSGLRHAASPSPRSTPTASIRPMAIGTVGASTSSQARMAAVLPTTVTSSAAPSTSDEGTVPQATVQPTPATATVAPTTVAQTVTPSSHTPVISEVAPTPVQVAALEIQITQSTVVSEPVPNIHIAAGPCVASHATALVSPRVEGIDSSDAVAVDSPAPTTSVIVSPPATQTQMVPPTVKRPREESQGSSESPEVAHKRVRMVSEGSQTSQQAPIVPSTSLTSVPTVAVVSRNKVEVSESSKSSHVEHVPSSTVSSSAVQASTSSMPTIAKDEPVIPASQKEEMETVEDKDSANAEWHSQESAKPEGDFGEEGMEEEEEPPEQMEEIEVEQLPGIEFSDQTREDEDMVDDAGDVEEMPEPSEESPAEVIDVLDDDTDNTMEADNLQSQSDEQCMAPPAFPVAQSTESISVPESTIGQATTAQSRRMPLPARIPMRQDRMPSSGRQQHLITIPDQPSRFEEGGDDSIVPSTPTLFVPRRTDGFAEAVSSPHIPPVRFLFSSSESSPTQQGLSQLASQGALGVDDTRMDLSQFDDGSGRTVPSTPQQVSPPAEAAVPEISDTVASADQSATEQATDSAVPVSVATAEDHDLHVTVSVASEQQQQQSSQSSEQDVAISRVEMIKAAGDSKAIGEEPKDVPKKPLTESDQQSGDAALSQQPSTSSDDSEVQKPKEAESSESELQSSELILAPTPQNVRKPIVWEEQSKPLASTAPSSVPSSSSSSSSTSTTSSQFTTSQPANEEEVSSRGRRLRYRGGGGNFQRGNYWAPPRRPRRSLRRGRIF